MVFTRKRRNNLDVNNSKLVPCPNSPNCLSNQSADAIHKIAPLTLF